MRKLLLLLIAAFTLNAFAQTETPVPAKPYTKMFIVNEINLIGLQWTELGLENEGMFSVHVMNSWNNWLSKNLPSNVQEVVICTGPCLIQFQEWQKLQQAEGLKVPEEIKNSIWIKVSFNLRKLKHAADINEWQFEWDGSVAVLDSNTKKTISSYTMLPERKTWRGLDQKSLNSKLASAIYRTPLDPFSKLVKKVQDTPKPGRLNRLVINGHANLSDVISLMDSLKKVGQNIDLEVQIHQFSQKEVSLLCFYQGEEKSFTDLLSQVKELKSSHSYKVVNEHNGVHHVLKLIAE